MATPPTLRKLGRAERALKPHNIAHQIDTLRSKVDEVIQALANLNTNVTGSVSGTAPAVAHAKWTGSYSTSSADGILDKYLRSDTTLFYPPALSTAAGSNKTVALTNDGTYGALLTSASTFSQNYLSLQAPNASFPLEIGQYGNIGMGGTAPALPIMLQFTSTIADNINPVQAIQANLTQTGSAGMGGSSVAAVNYIINHTGTSTSQLTGMKMFLKQNNASASGDVIGISCKFAIASFTGTRTNVTFYESGETLTTMSGGTVTNLRHYHVRMPLSMTSTLTNHIGMDINAISTGTNRYGVKIAAITGGTVATGVEIATHSGGTTRRGLRSGNTNECTANDFLCSTAAKGFIAVDGQGSPHFWRFTVAADGTPRVDDTGTSAPTT